MNHGPRGAILNHGVTPAVVCLRRVIKSSSVELKELEAGKRPRVPPSASVLRDLSSEDESFPSAPPLPSAGCLRSAACMLGPGARYSNAGAEPEPEPEPVGEPLRPPPHPFVSADVGGGATTSTRAMVAMTDLCHGVGGRAGARVASPRGRFAHHDGGKAVSGAGSGRNCEGRETVPLIKQARALLGPLNPLLLRAADRQRLVEEQAVCLRCLRRKARRWCLPAG